jgi:hypothetical protein
MLAIFLQNTIIILSENRTLLITLSNVLLHACLRLQTWREHSIVSVLKQFEEKIAFANRSSARIYEVNEKMFNFGTNQIEN